MSLKRSILSNYLSQTYVILIGIFMIPVYVRYMGAEAYGLVGFFSMSQLWFNLLDIGLTPTVARETARFRGGNSDPVIFRSLVRVLEGVFLVITVFGGAILFMSSDYLANDWLQVAKLPPDQVRTAIQLMAAIIASRMMGGLYRGVISGFERMAWLGGFNSFIATLRYVGVLPLLLYVGVTPTVFFGFQFFVAVVELIGLIIYAYHLMPALGEADKLALRWELLKPVVRFSVSIAFTSVIWVFITQTDKLILSKILPLEEYGYFVLTVLLASGVTIISGPISASIMPRLAALEARGDHDGLMRIYSQATQLVAVISGATAFTISLCAEQLLRVWTGDQILAKQAVPVLVLYALGNCVLTVSAFPYYLQYAKGNMRLHVLGNLVFVLLFVPIIILASVSYGSVGAGYVWFGMNVASFFVWLPFVHKKFEPGLNSKWYWNDVGVILISAALAGWVAASFLPASDQLIPALFKLFAVGGVTLLAGAVASSALRRIARDWRFSRLKEKEGR